MTSSNRRIFPFCVVAGRRHECTRSEQLIVWHVRENPSQRAESHMAAQSRTGRCLRGICTLLPCWLFAALGHKLLRWSAAARR